MKRRYEQWGIRFGTSINTAGYEWRMDPELDIKEDRQQRLLPAARGQEAARLYGRDGLDVARKSYNAFRQLALAIQGPTLEWPASKISKRKTVLDMIVVFANEYGTLWGDDDPRMLENWYREAADFLDLYDISHALRTADFRTFDQQTQNLGENDGWVYLGAYERSSQIWIALPGEVTETRKAPNALPDTRDYMKIATEGSPRTRAWMAFSSQINQKLDSGLSLRTDLLAASRAYIYPATLVQLLYTRMWLDVVGFEEVERQMTCLNCHQDIQGTKRKKFCSDECRWHHNNRRRSAL